jgi:PAS domain-containing protein
MPSIGICHRHSEDAVTGDTPRSAPGIEVFVENLPGNVYRRVRRPDGTYYFEYLSSGLFRQFDIDPERLLAQREVKWDWVHPDDRPRFVADLEVSAATLGLLDHRVRVVGKDGRVHWARGIARPSRRADGSVVWDGLVIEVTREV